MFRLFGKRCSIEPLMNTSSSLASRPFRRRSRKPSKRAASSGISFCAISQDRKSTRLNSSHLVISYAVFCLKKKKNYHLLLSQGALLHHQQLTGSPTNAGSADRQYCLCHDLAHNEWLPYLHGVPRHALHCLS